MGIVTTLPSKPKSGVMLSVIVPFYNESEVLPELHQRLTAVLDRLPDSAEILYVDDGSSDASAATVESFKPTSTPFTLVSLSRNFGKEAAMSAGLEYANGLAVIVLDADLQDPPELIPKMLTKWREGFDVVNMQRSHRHGESWVKRKSAALFYRLLNHLVSSPIPENVGDFRLISREVVDHINRLPERNRYMKGLYSWPGFRQATLSFERDARFSGETKWNYFKLIGLAIDGITSFSIKPLKIASIAGSLLLVASLLYAFGMSFGALMAGELPSMMSMMTILQMFLGAIQLICVGILGEYVGRIFIETKARPLYLVRSVQEKAPTFTPPMTSGMEKQA